MPVATICLAPVSCAHEYAGRGAHNRHCFAGNVLRSILEAASREDAARSLLHAWGRGSVGLVVSMGQTGPDEFCMRYSNMWGRIPHETFS